MTGEEPQTNKHCQSEHRIAWDVQEKASKLIASEQEQ